MAQMKGQIKTPEKGLNKMEISNLLDTEFKTLVIRMLKELSEDLNSIKKTQSEMKDTLIEKRKIYRETTVEWMNLRIKSIIWNIRKHKTTYQKTRIKNPKKEDSISSLWDNFKRSNIHILGGQEEEELEIYTKSSKRKLP